MLKKSMPRFLAVLLCLILIIMNMTPVFVSAGAFDESWFKGIENVYNEVGVFDAIDVGLATTTDTNGYVTVGDIYGGNNFSRMQPMLEPLLIKIQKNFVNNRGGKPSDSVFNAEENKGLYEWYWVSWIFYRLGNADHGTDLNFAHYAAGGFAATFTFNDLWGDGSFRDSFLSPTDDIGWVPTVQALVNELNSAPVDSRPVKLKALSDYIESIYRSYPSYLDNPAGTAEVYKDFVYKMTRFVVSGRMEEYMDRSWLDEVFTYNATLSAENSIANTAKRLLKSDIVDTNESAVYWYIYDRLNYLATIREKVREQMAQVPEGYFNNVVTNEKKAGTIEKNLAELVTDVSTGLRGILEGNTIRFENIIYGRVQTGNTSNVGVTVNNFSFELEKNNMYGIAGSMIYVLLRGIFIIGILCFFAYYLVKESMVVSARARSKLKENIGFVILSIFLLYAMPNLVDMFIHLRDLVLHAIANGFMDDSVFDAMGSLADQFKNAATTSLSLIDSCEYMGMIIITVYLAFVYIGMAAAMTIMFAFFPLFVIFSFRDHKVLNEWVTFTLGIITTPLIDAVLFVIPLIATKINVASDLVKLLLCMSIIPARGMIRRLLGFSSSTGAELVGLGAIMAGGRAIGAVARTARNTVGNVASGISNIRADRANARLYDGLASMGGETSGGSGDSLGSITPDGKERASAFGNKVADSPLKDTAAETFDSSGSSEGSSVGGSFISGVAKREEKFLQEHPKVDNFVRKIGGINNFESASRGMNVSPQVMAQMYRERARRTAAQTLFKTAGGVAGGVAGGAIGLGAGTFLGPNATMMMAGGGMAVGSELGSAAGNAAGTAYAYAGRTAKNIGGAIGGRSQTGVSPSLLDAATSYDPGIGFEDFGPGPVAPVDMNDEFIYGDIRAGIIGDSTTDTMNNIVANDTEFANTIHANFDSIINSDMSMEEKEAAMVTEYARYADIGAAMLNSDRAQVYDRSFIPADSKLHSMNAMHDCMRMGAEARMDLDGTIFYTKPSTMSDADYKNLEYAFPKIHHGYTAPSYYDEKNRKNFTPADGYIGSGMIENMKRGDRNGGWDIGNINENNVDGIEDVKVRSSRSETSSDKFVGGAVKGGQQYNPRNNSEPEDTGDPMERFYKEHPMEKFYREHPEMRPNVFT